jgi:PAS domain-containing protein
MIEKEISASYWNSWQRSLQMLADLHDCCAAILCPDPNGELQLTLAASPQSRGMGLNMPGLERELRQFCGMSVAKDKDIDPIKPRHAPQRLPAEVQGTEISGFCGKPLYWPVGKVFAVLCFFTQTEGLNADSPRLLCMLADSIEYQLTTIYREQTATHAVAGGGLATEEQDSRISDLQLFIDSFDEHIWVKDVHGKYALCNLSVLRAWEKSREEIIGKNDREIFGERISRHFQATDIQAIAQGRPIVIEQCEDSDADHSRAWLETVKAPMINGGGSWWASLASPVTLPNIRRQKNSWSWPPGCSKMPPKAY